MSWYTSIKTSMPVAVEDDTYQGYFSIGHGDYPWARERGQYNGREVDEVVIWGIDENFDWYELPGRDENGEKNDHGGFPIDDFLASGRYEKNNLEPNGVVSLATKIPRMPISTHQMDYMMKRVEKMLDERFDSPKILIK